MRLLSYGSSEKMKLYHNTMRHQLQPFRKNMKEYRREKWHHDQENIWILWILLTRTTWQHKWSWHDVSIFRRETGHDSVLKKIHWQRPHSHNTAKNQNLSFSRHSQKVTIYFIIKYGIYFSAYLICKKHTKNNLHIPSNRYHFLLSGTTREKMRIYKYAHRKKVCLKEIEREGCSGKRREIIFMLVFPHGIAFHFILVPPRLAPGTCNSYLSILSFFCRFFYQMHRHIWKRFQFQFVVAHSSLFDCFLELKESENCSRVVGNQGALVQISLQQGRTEQA